MQRFRQHRVIVRVAAGMAVLAISTAPFHLLLAQNQATTTRGALTPGRMAITNVSLIPMTRDTVVPNATVVIENGRITRITRSGGAPPAGTTVVDGRGKYLIPGLADMHVHLFADNPAIHDSSGAAELGVMVAAGVTTARLMIGTPQHLDLRKEVAAGRVVGPQLWVASPHINNRDPDNAYLVKTEAEAREAVGRAADAGYDFIKITFVTRPIYDAVVDEARNRRIRVVGHVDPDVGVARALEGGAQLEHLDSYFEALLADDAPMKTSVTQYGVYQDSAWRSLDYLDDAKIARLAGATARSGAVIGPTQNVFTTAFAIGESDSTIHNRPDWNMWPASLRDGYMRVRARYWGPQSLQHRTEARRARFVDVRRRLIKAIHDSGGTIIAGSDTPEWLHAYGWGLHRELQSYVAAGLRPFDALRTATVNPARYLQPNPDWGTIEVGKRADLVLLGANPLADIGNVARIEAVILGGRPFSRAELDAMITRGQQAVAAAARR
ncbi:MAG TPA: amidohydrolase family protein [Gemmatimonadaceae bacterium]|jgi:imidazolonepropionase-like amidohydrolase|nr:amidohydrolase family protein [Gemmatimonadaceae bacterium]